MTFTMSMCFRIIRLIWRPANLFCDRFGNFIGEEVESDAGSDAGVAAGDYVYDDEPQDDHLVEEEHMELDGESIPGPRANSSALCSN